MANEEHLKILKQGPKVWNQWRDEYNDVTPDLSSASLRRVYFLDACPKEQEVFMANLIDANLRGADLVNVDLCSILLCGADLFGADLNGANFKRADLEGANLTEARLHNADLSDSNLRNATLLRAFMNDTILANVDLGQSRRLEDVQHDGPSVIGGTTLEQSRGRIPEGFLRGCGLSDVEIEQAKLANPDLTPAQITDIGYKIIELRCDQQPVQFYSCFISYSHDDKVFARNLHDYLQDHGIRCWRDEKQMLPGDDIYDQVDRGIRQWDKLLLCCSEHSLTSWWVDNEIDTAFEKERKIMNDRKEKVLALIPLNLDDYMFSEDWTSGKKRQVCSRLAADFTNEANYEQEFDKVVKALRSDVLAREAPPTSKL